MYNICSLADDDIISTRIEKYADVGSNESMPVDVIDVAIITGIKTKGVRIHGRTTEAVTTDANRHVT